MYLTAKLRDAGSKSPQSAFLIRKWQLAGWEGKFGGQHPNSIGPQTHRIGSSHFSHFLQDVKGGAIWVGRRGSLRGMWKKKKKKKREGQHGTSQRH